MLLLMDGFDHYAYNDAQKKGWASDFSAAMVPGRFGSGQGAPWTPFAATQDQRIPFAQNTTATVVTGFAWWFVAAGPESPMFALNDGGTAQITFGWDGNQSKIIAHQGGLSGAVIGSSSVLPVNANGWNHCETKVLLATSGNVTMKINGLTVMTLTGVNTKTTANAYATHFCFPASNNVGGNIQFRFDDLFGLDSSGGENNDFIGDCRVRTLYPNADGAEGTWTPSTAGAHFGLVDEVVLNVADYVSSNVVGNTDTYAYGDVAVSAVIKAVQMVATATKDDAFARSVTQVVRQGGTDYTTGNKTLTASWQALKTILEDNPATTSPWLPTDLNANEFGIKVAA